MNKKHIHDHLKKKVDDWLASIPDPSLVEVLRGNVIVTGGAIVSLLQGEKPRDYDVYLRTEEACVAVATHYAMQWNRENPGKGLVEIRGQDGRVEWLPVSWGDRSAGRCGPYEGNGRLKANFGRKGGSYKGGVNMQKVPLDKAIDMAGRMIDGRDKKKRSIKERGAILRMLESIRELEAENASLKDKVFSMSIDAIKLSSGPEVPKRKSSIIRMIEKVRRGGV